MLLCKNCIFSSKVPESSHHLICKKRGVKVSNSNENAIKKGYFNFPFNFDPIWAENCNSFIPKNWKELSELEILLILSYEAANIELHLENSNKMYARKEDFFKNTSLLNKDYQNHKYEGNPKVQLQELIEKTTHTNKSIFIDNIVNGNLEGLFK